MSKGEQTHTRIVKEAAALLNQHGYEGMAYSDLMAATGLEKGGIYRHFANKEDLAVEAFQYAWTAAVYERQRDLELVDNSVERLKLFVSNFVRRRSGVPGGCPLFNTAVDADDGNPALRKQAEGALREWLGSIARLIQRGQRRGEIDKQVEARQIARLIVSTLEGALIISRLEKSDNALLEAEAHLHVVCEGLSVFDLAD